MNTLQNGLSVPCSSFMNPE